MSDYIFKDTDNVDEKKCIYNLDNSVDFYILVLESFVKESVKIESNLILSFDKFDIEKYRIAVHGLKSTAEATGFLSLSNNARELEYCCKCNNWEGIVKGHDNLLKQFKDSILLIQTRLNEYKENM